MAHNFFKTKNCSDCVRMLTSAKKRRGLLQTFLLKNSGRKKTLLQQELLLCVTGRKLGVLLSSAPKEVIPVSLDYTESFI